MKKLLSFVLVLLSLLIFTGCEDNSPTKLATPSNFTINGDVASWDVVENAAKYRFNIVNEENKEFKRMVNEGNSVDMKSFNLAYGIYNVYIQAVADDSGLYLDSDYSAAVEYEFKEDIPVLTLIEGEEMVDNNYIKWQGRTSYNSTLNVNMIYHSASSFEVKFMGTQVTCELYATKATDSAHKPYIVIMVDDDYENRQRIALTKQYTTLTIADLPTDDGKVHTVTVYKSTESIDSHIGLKSISTNGTFVPGIEYKDRHIEFIAASSSTGHGNMGSPTVSKSTENSDCMQAFSYLTARALNSEISIYSASGWGCKFSRWTSPNNLNIYDAYKYIDFSFYQNKDNSKLWNVSNVTPDVIVINLGTNDWSYINNTSDATERAARMQAFKDQYVDFLNYLNNAYPTCKIIVFYGLMNEGQAIYDATDEIYNRAKETIPTLAKIQVSGDGLGSAGHPSVESHKEVADQLIAKIKQEMGW